MLLTLITLFLTNLPKKTSKFFFLIFDDFNINLLNYKDHQPTNEFLHSLASNPFLPYNFQLTRLTSHSNTLIDNNSPM